MSYTQDEVIADHRIDLGDVASRYSPMLFRIALGRLRNVEDAEDALQDALLSACKHIAQFEGRSELSTWLTRIVINVTNMKLRSHWHHEVVSLDQAPESGEATLANKLVDAGPNPETICAQSEMEELLRRALAHISPKLSLTFQMREIAGFSTRELAGSLKTKTSTLNSRVKRARSAIGLYLHEVEGTKLADESKARVMNGTAAVYHHRDLQPVTDSE